MRTTAAGCVVDARSIAGGNGAVFLEGGLEGGRGASSEGVGADALVVIEDGGGYAFFCWRR